MASTSNAIDSLSGIEARLAKVENVINSFASALSGGAGGAVSDVVGIASGVATAIAAPTPVTIAGVAVPVTADAVNLFGILEQIFGAVKTAVQTKAQASQAVAGLPQAAASAAAVVSDVLTGGEAVGNNHG